MNETEARERLDQLIELSSESTDETESTFSSPAQARAFSLVVALSREGAVEWDAFQRQLIDRIATDDGSLATETERTYYDHWVAALERLLRENGEVTAAELEERAEEFASGDRDASEFVVGDRTH